MQKYSLTVSALLLAVLVAAFGVVTQVNAQERSQDQTGSTMQGKVSSVDSSRGQLNIKDDQGNEKTLQVSSTTRISKAGREIKLTEIKVGDQVQLVVDGTGDNPAVKTIVVLPTKTSNP
ncbi:MAG TPA: hypothetical protein VJ302_06710 [Blastocatellia bacterium]|nr:hypothetical protein [Blastocatellia bacterium]